MKIPILALAGAALLTGAAAAHTTTAETCKITPKKHAAVKTHRSLAANTSAHTTRRVRVLADAPTARTYTEPEARPVPPNTVYEREYAYEAPPPPPPYPEYGYAAPYPVYPYGPVVVGYGPRWHGPGWGYHRGWRRW